MLQNSFKSQDSLTRRNTGARETDYSTTWGRSSAVDKKGSYPSNISSGRDYTAEVTEQILSSYDTGACESRATFMKRLINDSMQHLADQQGARMHSSREQAAFGRAVADLVKWFFGQLELCSYEFNRVVGWGELNITTTAPDIVTEVLRTNRFGEILESVTHFRARLSTRHMSLVIRGSKRRIDFFLIPVDKVIGLSRAESTFVPVASLTAQGNADTIWWEVNRKPIDQAGMEVMVMCIFEQLVTASREQSTVNNG